MEATVVCLSCGVILLFAAAHPFVTYPLSLALLRRRTDAAPATIDPASLPSVAVCLSLFNEQAVIIEKVESLLAQARTYGPATIHIYTDGCDDNTVALLQPYRDRVDLVVSNERRGKTHGMATLVSRSTSDLLVFTDANVRAPETALVDLAGAFRDPRVGCASAQLTYANPGESAISLISALYWWIEESVKALEDRTVGVIGVDGAMFMIRRAHYHLPPPNLIDDLYVSLKVLLDGLRVVRVPQLVVTERSATGVRDEYRRKARIACQAMNVHRDLWSGLRRLPMGLVYGYVSHRIVKWMMPFFLVGSAICFLATLVVAVGALKAAMILGAAVLLFGLAIAVGFRPAALIWATLAAITGTGKGVLESILAGKKYVVWDPVASVRVDKSLGGGSPLGR